MLYGVETLIVDAGIQAGLVQQGLPRTRQNVTQLSPADQPMGDLELCEPIAFRSLPRPYSGFQHVSCFHNADGIPQQVRQHLSGAASGPGKPGIIALHTLNVYPLKAFTRMASAEMTEMDDSAGRLIQQSLFHHMRKSLVKQVVLIQAVRRRPMSPARYR
eukprot:759106-Hanusia_phi.AAC.1